VKEDPYYFTKNKNNANVWVETGRWMVPQGYPKFVCCVAIEAYSCFMLVSSDANQTNLLFFSLSMKLFNVSEMAHINNVISGDFDQLRKDLILGLKGGALLSTIIRKPEVSEKGLVDTTAPVSTMPSHGNGLHIMTENLNSGGVGGGGVGGDGNTGKDDTQRFLAIPRKHSRFSKSFLGMPAQICSQDLLSTFIVLSDNGTSCVLLPRSPCLFAYITLLPCFLFMVMWFW